MAEWMDGWLKEWMGEGTMSKNFLLNNLERLAINSCSLYLKNKNVTFYLFIFNIHFNPTTGLLAGL